MVGCRALRGLRREVLDFRRVLLVEEDLGLEAEMACRMQVGACFWDVYARGSPVMHGGRSWMRFSILRRCLGNLEVLAL